MRSTCSGLCWSWAPASAAGGLDGKRFPVSEDQPGTNYPPMHPWCRSTTMPDMSAEQLRKVSRAARDPETGKSITVPGDMTYRQWYEKFVEGAENPVADFRKMKYNAPEKWDEQQIEIAHQTIEQAILKGPENDDFGAVLRKNHIGLSKYTPETMKKALEQAGFVVRPLNRGNFKGVPFEQGGGYKTNYGGNGIFQYHPPARSHHGGAYWKISDTKEQERYGMDGTKK